MAFILKVKLWTEETQKHQVIRRDWFDEITERRNIARAEVLKSLDPILTEYFKQNQISLMLYKRNMSEFVNARNQRIVNLK